ncbi:MAG: TraK family protein [Pseudomonadota bacterium]
MTKQIINKLNTVKEMLLVDKKNEKRTGQSRVLFLARKSEIEEAFADGWSAKEIWKSLHSRELFPATYDCFIRHVRRYIKHKASTKEENTPQTKPLPKPIKPTEPSNPKTDTNSDCSAFIFSSAPSLDINNL